MFRTSFSIGSLVPYRVSSLEIYAKVFQIDAVFEDGDHIFTSSDFELGTVYSISSRPLIGQLRFHYSYNAERKIITVCGTDYASADGGFEEDEFSRNEFWNYRSQLMPGAAQVFKNIVRGANDALIAALHAALKTGGLRIVRERESLPELPVNVYNDLSEVYLDGKLLGKYDPTCNYDPGLVVRGLGSKYRGTATWKPMKEFANVIGSTDDPKHKVKSWIGLWREVVGVVPVKCTSFGYNQFKCGEILYGGHIIDGTTARELPKGADCYIFPICIPHNNVDKTMAAIEYTTSIWLEDYMN